MAKNDSGLFADHRKTHPDAYRPARLSYGESGLMSDRYWLYSVYGHTVGLVSYRYNWLPWLAGWWCSDCDSKRCEHVAFARAWLGQ